MIGLFGGTFDPIHLGHLRPALEVAESLGLEQVRFIPGALPPHRQAPWLSSERRAEMVALAIEGEPRFRLDRRELERQAQAPDRPSYTVDTLESFRRELGAEQPLFLIMGTDAFLGLESWHRWADIIHLANLVVMTRPGYELQSESGLMRALGSCRVSPGEVRAIAAGQLIFQPVTSLDISATAIREGLREGRSPRYLVPEKLANYLQALALTE